MTPRGPSPEVFPMISIPMPVSRGVSSMRRVPVAVALLALASSGLAQGPGTVVSWTSSYSETGVLGEAELATKEKGRRAYEEAVRQLVTFVRWFKDRPKDQRRDRHRRPPTIPIPWDQTPLER